VRRRIVGLVTLLCALAAAPAATALTPVSGGTYLNRVAIDGLCILTDGGTDPVLQWWQVATVEPRRVHGGSGNVEIAPDPLPRVEVLGDGVTDDFSAAPYPQGMVMPEPPDGPCRAQSLSIDAQVSGLSVLLGRPGPYVFMQHDFTAHFVQVPDVSDDPTPQACQENDTAYFPFPNGSTPTSPPAADHHWAVDTFCNKVTVIPFNVQGDTGACPANGDMSQWPSVGYINQYDAGARLGLPLRFGARGGNACGPSSLLMGLLRLGAPSPLPSLGEAFDGSMGLPRSRVADEQQNSFQPSRAVAYLRSLGFGQARTINLGTSSQDANVENVATLYEEVVKGPVIASTAFGARRWGRTGGGHMILVTGIRDGNFVVSDPAGNFFSGKTGHYGAGKCGYQVTYPLGWVKASIVGRYLVTIGPFAPRTRSRSARAATAALGTALAVTDTHPDSADNPRSFYLRNADGRRAGWIDGAIVEEIPGAYVGKPPAGWDDTGGGDDDPVPADPPSRPRTIVISEPQPGTTLQVAADQGWALSVDSWVDGSNVGHDELTGAGSGQDAAVRSPALDGLVGTGPPAEVTPAPAPAPTSPTPAPTPMTAPLATVAVRRLAISPRVLRRSTRARVTFRLNRAARVRFTVERRVRTRWRRVPGRITRTGKAGANRFTFDGRIGGRRLRAGRYRLVAVPTVGTRPGAAARTEFRVAR